MIKHLFKTITKQAHKETPSQPLYQSAGVTSEQKCTTPAAHNVFYASSLASSNDEADKHRMLKLAARTKPS